MDDLGKSVARANQHWRPQHHECPFCLVNFTVYAKMEELDEDAKYFVTAANLTSRVEADYVHNPSMSGGDNKDCRFWSRVDPDTARRICQVFRLDFDMFGYSEKDYFRELGLIERFNFL